MKRVCSQCGYVQSDHDASQVTCPQCGRSYAQDDEELNMPQHQKISANNATQQNDDVEKAIQDEIRRRILERQQTIQEEKQQGLQTQATLEALEEITEISHEESQQIAQQVREEYTRKHNRKVARQQTIRKGIAAAVLISTLIALIVGGIRYYNYRRYANIAYKAIFTTGLTADNSPINEINEISIQEDRVYLYIFWRFLPKGTHHLQIRIFDGSGALADSYNFSFFTEGGRYYTWNWTRLSETVDVPGRWKFEIYLNDKKMGEEYVSVLSPTR